MQKPYSYIIKENKKLGKRLIEENPYKIGILSNITTFQLNEVLEFGLRSKGINARVTTGNFNNIVQDSENVSHLNAVIVFLEPSNIIDGLHYKSNTMETEQVNSLISEVEKQIDFVISKLAKTPLVFFNRISSLIFDHCSIEPDTFNMICIKLDAYMMKRLRKNMIYIDIEKIIAKNSIAKSIDMRFYYSSKALYSVDFYRHYVEFIKPIILSANGMSKKVIVFDCDDTLWKGILGENGNTGINMSSDTPEGAVFEEIQHIALALKKKGVVLALCSKNNSDEVDEVINSHPDMKLMNEDISIKKINWNNKTENIKQIAKELNVGLDSLLFVDDSGFEIELINKTLPQVETFQVPKNIFDYMQIMREKSRLFYSIMESMEDKNRTIMYQQESLRQKEKEQYSTVDDFLGSLRLKLIIQKCKPQDIPRLAQLTQKTNQFNLTTRRYSESEIISLVENSNCRIFTLRVSDKFGDYGITGLCIVFMNIDSKSANIDTFLISCRIIGRNVELAFFDFLVKRLVRTGINTIISKYIQTRKNSVVRNFYEKLSFEINNQSKETTEYELLLDQYKPHNLGYISVIYE